jgi:FkbM family methyltransferase
MLRWPLRLIPKSTIVPILQGPLQGRRWIVGSATHGAWLGSYEADKLRLFAESIRPNMVVWDLGANAGLYTLLASLRAGAGRVVAFEPLPANLNNLRRHIALNHCSNANVVPKAVSDWDGTALFSASESAAMGTLSDVGMLSVETIRLDTFWKTTNSTPHVIKMDIEGAEMKALEGGSELLRLCRPVIFLAVHSDKLSSECSQFLLKRGYDLKFIDDQEIVAHPSRSK